MHLCLYCIGVQLRGRTGCCYSNLVYSSGCWENFFFFASPPVCVYMCPPSHLTADPTGASSTLTVKSCKQARTERQRVGWRLTPLTLWLRAAQTSHAGRATEQRAERSIIQPSINNKQTLPKHISLSLSPLHLRPFKSGMCPICSPAMSWAHLTRKK